jgi:hypothetical protein
MGTSFDYQSGLTLSQQQHVLVARKWVGEFHSSHDGSAAAPSAPTDRAKK